MVRGWVYVISNKAMPELVKVGYSERDPTTRAAELGAGTEVPYSYEVVYDVLVYSPYDVEQQVHRNLAEMRAGKEWFACDWLKAVAVVRRTAEELSEILSEKEYEILTALKNERMRLERETRELEEREKERQERERMRTANGQETKPSNTSKSIEATRIVICPKCYSNVKTEGRPPPYFCIQCGSKFLLGI